MDFQPMKLEERHKEFAVRCYARFMKRAEVTNAFMEEFATDIANAYLETSKSETPQALVEELMTEAAQEIPKDAAYRTAMRKLEMLKSASNKFDNASEEQRDRIIASQMVREYLIKLKANLSDRLRRLNITHRQFPEKYRDLFNQTRKEYFVSYRTENLQNSDNVILELETLYGYVKQRIFQEVNPKEAMKHVNLAHNILKTIATSNAINARQEVIDVTPQNTKQLTDT
ncbi:MAG: hypothetical protein OXI43_13375 [Candidatus Poribacteria bacterium]|nr:hypothetical protein [Candidatus Poribacteria bacterium]